MPEAILGTSQPHKPSQLSLGSFQAPLKSSYLRLSRQLLKPFQLTETLSQLPLILSNTRAVLKEPQSQNSKKKMGYVGKG